MVGFRFLGCEQTEFLSKPDTFLGEDIARLHFLVGMSHVVRTLDRTSEGLRVRGFFGVIALRVAEGRPEAAFFLDVSFEDVMQLHLVDDLVQSV